MDKKTIIHTDKRRYIIVSPFICYRPLTLTLSEVGRSDFNPNVRVLIIRYL
ncbi:MAG: hypothetical protein SOX82_11915 [Eubacteriales bacterium]|nr:hypothetical protein [Eubacteriales bacterium]